MLVSEGAMRWDSPITNQLPAFKLRDCASAQQVTVRDVLSHRVGLTHNTYDRDLEGNAPYPLLAEKLVRCADDLHARAIATPTRTSPSA